MPRKRRANCRFLLSFDSELFCACQYQSERHSFQWWCTSKRVIPAVCHWLLCYQTAAHNPRSTLQLVLVNPCVFVRASSALHSHGLCATLRISAWNHSRRLPASTVTGSNTAAYTAQTEQLRRYAKMENGRNGKNETKKEKKKKH